jgi:hypothetical protein
MNMARINMLAGDLVNAYAAAFPGAEAGDSEAIRMMIEICEKAGDQDRSARWRAVLETARQPG